MKPSRYNIYCYQDDNIYVVNILNNSYLKINNDAINKSIIDQLKNKNEVVNSEINSEIVQKLYSHNFILDNESNEDDRIRELINSEYDTQDVLKLTIIPTLWCNFDCVYCYQDYEHLMMSEDVLNSIYKYIYLNINKYKVLDIGWFGGEPLCAQDIIINLMRKLSGLCFLKKKKLFGSMSTNGYLLNSENFIQLYNSGVRGFQITLDGFAQDHNRLRKLKNGGPTFDKIVNNLRFIKKNDQYNDLRIIIRLNITKKSDTYMNEFIKYLSNEFSNDKRFHLDFQPVVDMGSNCMDKIKDDLINDNFDINKYIALAKEMGLNIYTPNIINRCGNICYAARNNNYYLFNYDGKVQKCTAKLNNENNIIGQLNTNGEIELNENAVIWREIRNKKYDKCNECKYFPACCSLSCPLSYIENHTPKCSPIFKKIDQDLLLKLINQNKGVTVYDYTK